MAEKAFRAGGRWLTCFAALVALASAAPQAGAAGASVMVSATVLKNARLDMRGQPLHLQITAADIERGYIDVLQAGQLSVRFNSEGYILEFVTESEMVRSMTVGGAGDEVEFGPRGGGAARNAAGSGTRGESMHLRYKFRLTESTRPGIHPWPVRVTVTAF